MTHFCFSFLAFFSTPYLQCSQATVGLVTHLLQQRHFFLVQYQLMCNKELLQEQTSGFPCFFTLFFSFYPFFSLLSEEAYVSRLHLSQACNGQGKWNLMIFLQMLQMLPQKPIPTHPLSL